MKEIEDPKVAAIKCSWGTQIELENFDWLSKNQYNLD